MGLMISVIMLGFIFYQLFDDDSLANQDIHQDQIKTLMTVVLTMEEKTATSQSSQDDLETITQRPKETETQEAVSVQYNQSTSLVTLTAISDPQTNANSFDWRNHNGGNWLSPVRDQGDCGGCFAFSAIAVTEAAIRIANNDYNMDIDLSEQYLISDCDYYSGYGEDSGSCCGGYSYEGLDFIMNEGVPDEACMSFTDGDNCECEEDYGCTGEFHIGEVVCSNTTCSDRCSDWEDRLVKLDEIGYVENDRESIQQALREYGPLAGAMLYEEDDQFDENGIYRCQNYIDTEDLLHEIVIVGYNDNEEYWIIRNSWGPDWNGDGYFKLGYGECGIEEDVYYGIIF